MRSPDSGNSYVPPNVFDNSQLRNNTYEPQPAQHHSSHSTQASRPQSPLLVVTTDPGDDSPTPADPPVSANPSAPASPPPTGGRNKYSIPANFDDDSDEEMFDAPTSFGDDRGVNTTSKDDLLSKIPNIFRLLDLYQEIGSGGLVEKMIIDQHSLYRLLNQMSPGSYELPWKINFRLLDQLVIKPVGLYGSKSEIIKFLRGVDHLSVESEALLAATESSSAGLRSGLYLVLPLQADGNDDRTHSAYIIYWPEDTTWDDKAISSVRRNRVTFMRYLSKLTDQTIALVSEQQAKAIVWQAGARNADAPSAAAETNDEARLNFFEVAMFDESEEDVIARPGFSLKLKSRDIPRLDEALQIELVTGEEKAGLVVSRYEPARATKHKIASPMTEMSIRNLIKSTRSPIVLGKIPPDQVLLLGDLGLKDSYPKQFSEYSQRMRGEEQAQSRDYQLDIQNAEKEIKEDRPRLRDFVKKIIQNAYRNVYPFVYAEHEGAAGEDVNFLCDNYPGLKHLLNEVTTRRVVNYIDDSTFQNLKQAWCITRDFLQTEGAAVSEANQIEFVKKVLKRVDEEKLKTNGNSQDKQGFIRGLVSSISNFWQNQPKSYEATKKLSDPEFVAAVQPLLGAFPAVSELTDRIVESLQTYLSTTGSQLLKEYVSKFTKAGNEHRLKVCDQLRRDRARVQSETALLALREQLVAAMPQDPLCATRIDSIEVITKTWGYVQYHIRGHNLEHHQPQTRFSIYPLELTEHDIQQCGSNELHIPLPTIGSKQRFEFALHEGHTVEFLQLVRDKCLVVVAEPEKHRVYMEDNIRLESVILNKSSKRQFENNRLGGKPIFAFDQGTRLFAILHGVEEPKLQVFSFDESFSALSGRGSALSLREWYEGQVSIKRICFVSGTEEICLVDDSGHTRILSLVTRHFRPASLTINGRIMDMFSAPDGSCLFAAVASDDSQTAQHRLMAFHIASFGSNEDGIQPTMLPLSNARRIVTSFEGRNHIHVLSLNLKEKTLESTALQIKQKVTEFSFRSNQAESASVMTETWNNCLLDCHMEVWTRFPVLPAVVRSTLSLHGRESRQLIFSSSSNLDLINDYFSRMITKFELTTRKPLDGSLSAISVKSSSASPHLLVESISRSRYQLGGFIVELLCLIPLHLAITRDNRFIPLKDGVWDPMHERSLLGADVPTIIEKLSIGWYESLFQSYMATKPVRVVSSMGEQSVGKSYCLNHFADTSFAGSAMRTTEGVWLSCTPTNDYLLVSLDFEGVHSIERSAQEDALLVLFNTAISNLVLFRNNFALSRDIAGLFTSFQSSAMVLDPQTNPGLFNSTLAIIIKDVTDSDSKDIVKEFSLKFQRIVQREQQQNFITRLHRGRIQIIPWPVINSPSFYALFQHLRRYMDSRPVTHSAGGVFLHNLKTLMAKIKASDWGSLDQNLAAHRAIQLTERLHAALSHGRAEQGIDSWGPLKNLDTDEELPSMDLDAVLFVPNISENNAPENETAMRELLRMQINRHGQALESRHILGDSDYVQQLQQRLFGDLERRFGHVRNWIDKNVERFPAGNQDIRNVYAKYENATLIMRGAVRLCLSTCAECHFQCLLPSRHSGSHDCTTTHRCERSCEIEEGHASPVVCGLLAGHTARHMCNVRAHSCGHDCHLKGKAGCAESCVQPLDHEGEHLCSARSHLCGQPCSLINAKEGYHCPGRCSIIWDEPHTRHSCDNAKSCPFECRLCRRLCCEPDHFHGLNEDAVHLCGQKHDCTNLCAASGICRIDTQPSTIEEQFSGRHQAFQYTRYSQVQQRLTCVIPIPAGELQHQGAHTHSTETDVFHFCDTRCPDCQYFCTLPLGHTQQLHETSHGSMTTTQWVLEGTDPNAVYELGGRKFGTGDEGAPLLCHMLCADQGRHAHIDYCRDGANCTGPEQQHIPERMHPDPNQPKDWITHRLKWARNGFKDPYSRDQQVDFAKCDVLCSGSEHEANGDTPARPSYCKLPIFHAPQARQAAQGNGYVSQDGHSFDCQDPSRLHQSYHIVFVIDSSSSMGSRDRQPLSNTPLSAMIRSACNNRYGAVLSALYSFWYSREPPVSTQARQDAYSVITFNNSPSTRFSNDFTSTTEQLVTQLIPQRSGGTNFNAALAHAQALIRTNWSSDRAPVLVFLSDGECTLRDDTVHDLCRMCIQLGKPLALYAVSFGPDTSSASLRRMVNVAQTVYASAPQDALTAARGNPCAFRNAIDSIQLAETFLGIASSLQKPRASLIGQSGAHHTTC